VTNVTSLPRHGAERKNRGVHGLMQNTVTCAYVNIVYTPGTHSRGHNATSTPMVMMRHVFRIIKKHGFRVVFEEIAVTAICTAIAFRKGELASHRSLCLG